MKIRNITDTATCWINENGQLHSDTNPAIIYDNGFQGWYHNGLKNRAGGPAIIREDNTKEWWVNDRLQRTDGPAVEHSDGANLWYINGVRFTENEYHKAIPSIAEY